MWVRSVQIVKIFYVQIKKYELKLTQTEKKKKKVINKLNNLKKKHTSVIGR